jgi:hypothetical protein
MPTAEDRLTRRIALILVALAIPLASRVGGSGRFAWTMFSQTSRYRIRIEAEGRDGVRRIISPSALASAVSPSVRFAFAGAEAWRQASAAESVLAPRVPEIAQLSCRVLDARSVIVRFDRQADLDAPITSSTVEERCAP